MASSIKRFMARRVPAKMGNVGDMNTDICSWKSMVMLTINWRKMPRLERGFGLGRSDLTAIKTQDINVLMKVSFHAALWGRRLFPSPNYNLSDKREKTLSALSLSL